MAISVSFDTNALLNGPKFVARPVVIVLPHSIIGTPFAEDLSNRVKSIVVNASMDNSVMQATITLAMGSGSDNLSPFYYASSHRGGVYPLLQPGAEVYVGFEISATGALGSGEQVFVFIGRVDRVGTSSKEGTCTLECRDVSSWWLNTMVRESPIYGSDAGIDAYTEMLHIMDDAAEGQLGTVLGLVNGAPADYAIYTQAVGPGPVLDIVRSIAQQCGRDIRWFASRGLVYYEPSRSVVIDGVISDRRYESITELSWGDEDVRNIWEVYYSDADGMPHGPVGAEDGNSIQQYGPRYARVYLTRAENIRDDTQALRMASAALADSKDPFASHEISGPLDPRIELNDLYLYLPNYREYDQDQYFATIAFRHEYTAVDQPGQPGVVRTTVGARGSRIAAYRDYRRSVPPPNIISKVDVPLDLWAPEGTVYYKVDDLTPP